tara:strand:+ start:995 stop:1159 length:165 start_codon:yes stop_codon:yes gene_type:complete
MKQFIKENLDVFSINTITIGLSLTQVHAILQIIALVVGIFYTIDKIVYFRKNRK